MDSKILSTEELQLLKDFISSRGFKDELVQAEILDHFASKVEEVLTNKSKLTLHDAMYEAHQSFGVLGFYVIQANFEKNTRSRYSKLYWQSIKSIVSSVPHMLAVVIIWWLCYKGYLWAEANHYNHILENDMSFGLTILIVASSIFMAIKFRHSNDYYSNLGKQASLWYNTGLMFIVISGPHSENAVNISSIIKATAAALYLVAFIAQYRLMKAAAKDYDEYKRIAS